MKTLAEQIAALEAKRAASAARMDAVMQKSLDEDRTTRCRRAGGFDTLAAEVEAIDKDLVRLRKLESTKAVAAKPVIKAETAARGQPRARRPDAVYAVPKQKIAPQDYVWRSLVCKLKAHFTKQSPYQVLKDEYGDDEPTRAVMNVITRAATVPADTVTSGWASQLVDTSIQDFFAALLPNGGLSGIGVARRKILVRPRRHRVNADTGEHADDCRIVRRPGRGDPGAARCVLRDHLHAEEDGGDLASSPETSPSTRRPRSRA